MMFKFVFKKFADKDKFEKAKIEAMKLYEKFRNEESISKNRKIEENMLQQDKRNKNMSNSLRDVNDYKNVETKAKIESLMENYEFINDRKSKLKTETNPDRVLNLNYYNKIKEGVLYYKLKNDFYKAFVDQDNWVKIYESKYDPNYEKFINFILNFLKVVVVVQTIFFIKKLFFKAKKNNNNNKQEGLISYKDVFIIFMFYAVFLSIYLMNSGFNKRLVSRILVKDDKVRIFMKAGHNAKNKFLEIEILKLFSITSKTLNLHEILYIGSNNKISQLFVNKNAYYDKSFLTNLCNPDVKKVKFSNLE